MFFKKKKKLSDDRPLPDHIGIIMDGNGRWAKKRGLARSMGHAAGAKTFRKIARYCNEIGIKVLTVYAFSTENWSRPQKEIDSILNLLQSYLREALKDFKDENIRTRFIGDITPFSDELKSLIAQAEESTRHKTGMQLNIALNYGGRAEIVMAAKKISEMYKNGELELSDIDEDVIKSKLYTGDQPDPDLIIRPSGEQRLSNFLLWQSAYSELWFSDILWPDFTTRDLEKAIEDYLQRNRRFGGV